MNAGQTSVDIHSFNEKDLFRMAKMTGLNDSFVVLSLHKDCEKQKIARSLCSKKVARQVAQIIA